jgi:hypothetical protein
MQDYEKLGLFYLGRLFDLDTGKTKPQELLYQSKDLTTHAVCVGMTGSGKTGLCLGLLEEAAIDGIPVIAIDPKGDLGNLLLAFPDLKPDDFQPWVDPDDAARKGIGLEELAAQTAASWKKGLADWQQDGDRVKRYRDSVDMAIYTPGSQAGLPLTVLRSFAAPPAALLANGEALRDRVIAAASGLLALLGISADPVTSREHILLSNILDRAWRDGRSLDLAALIRAIQTPGFDKVGVVDLESFFPAKERHGLAMSLNNLLASPGFAGWLEGESLDIGSLLRTSAGKPRLSVLSIAHLSDSERMFFVTILLNELLAWARTQPGTSSLRAILYMDEVFGYFPPTANPPSKLPMLTLLKQARAFGLGIVLATQNPVDLDYKGLSNAGTWFLGRLQTERDKARVLDGLAGASAEAGASFDRGRFAEILSRLGNRVFLMNNVHENQPQVFQTRWTLSYLHGPLSREQIGKLMASRRAAALPDSAGAQPAATARPAALASSSTSHGERPVLPPEVREVFIAPPRTAAPHGGFVYRPALLAGARIHFTNAKAGVDEWQGLTFLRPIEDSIPDELWAGVQPSDEAPELVKEPEAQAAFASLPPELARAKSYAEWATSLKNYLYREQTLTVWKCAALKATSKPGESEGDFRGRIAHDSHEKRDADNDKLRAAFAPKIAALEERRRKAQQRVDKEKAQAGQSYLSAGVAVVSSLLQVFGSRKLASAQNISKASSAARAAGRAMQQHGDIGHATESVEAIDQQLADLDAELKQQIDALESTYKADSLALEAVPIRPKKTDISVESVSLAWIAG